MEQNVSVDLWKIIITTGLAAIGWFVRTLYNKVESQVDSINSMDKDLGILDSSVKHLDKAMNDHKGEVKVIMEKFSSVEHGVTQLQTYHEQNQQNWEFVFKKLDALGEDIAAIKR